MPATFFPIVLLVHIVLAVSLFLPSILLPFTLRTRRATVESESRVVRRCCGRSRTARSSIGAGLALTGLGLDLDPRAGRCSPQPWLLLALASTSPTSAIAFFIQRPNLRRLVGIKAAADDAALEGAGQAPALRVVPDGRPGRRRSGS